MVVECPICSKVLNNEEICSYCGTNINEDIFTDFTSFQKLKNSFSGTFGKGLSKNDKKDFSFICKHFNVTFNSNYERGCVRFRSDGRS